MSFFLLLPDHTVRPQPQLHSLSPSVQSKNTGATEKLEGEVDVLLSTCTCARYDPFRCSTLHSKTSPEVQRKMFYFGGSSLTTPEIEIKRESSKLFSFCCVQPCSSAPALYNQNRSFLRSFPSTSACLVISGLDRESLINMTTPYHDTVFSPSLIFNEEASYQPQP